MKRSTKIVKSLFMAASLTMMAVPVMAEISSGMDDTFADGLAQESLFSATVSLQNNDLLARGGNGGGGNGGGGGGNGGGRNGDADGSGDGSADGSRPADGTGRGPGTGDCINV